MNHHDIDPSLRAGEPLNDSLDDGFSARVDESSEPDQQQGTAPVPRDLTLNPKSLF